MSIGVKRTIDAIAIALFICSGMACQRSEEKPPAEKSGGDEAKGDPPGQGKVKTTKSPAKQGDDEMADVVIKTTQVAGHIYMLEGQGGNIGVSAGEDGVVLVDDQFAALAPKILDAVKRLGKGEPEYVINTHWHPDHIGGNTEFGAKAAIVAHENVRKRLSTAQKRRTGELFGPLPPVGLPVVTYQENVSLHMNGEEIRLMHFPRGHTDGDTIVFFTGAKVVHMGDHFFNGRFPFVDTESGGDPVQFAANVKSVLDRIGDDYKVIPGHGPLASKADLAAFHAMLTETMQIVSAAKKAGKSLEQAQKAGLPEKYKTWGEGFIKTDVWIETIYKAAK
jgi:cyclase